jgi:hypothetical protein
MRKLQNGAKEQKCLMYTGIIQFCESDYFPICVCLSHTSFPGVQILWLIDLYLVSIEIKCSKKIAHGQCRGLTREHDVSSSPDGPVCDIE